MKITKRQLGRLIRETISEVMSNPDWSTIKDDDYQWGEGKKSMSDHGRTAFTGIPTQQYKAKVAAALVNNAQYLLDQGVPGDHKVAIIRDEEGYFMPQILGTIDQVAAARSVGWFFARLGPRWDNATDHNIQIQHFDVGSEDELDGITLEDTPFYSIGRYFA